jgi:small subunit ribosomal protein S17
VIEEPEDKTTDEPTEAPEEAVAEEAAAPEAAPEAQAEAPVEEAPAGDAGADAPAAEEPAAEDAPAEAPAAEEPAAEAPAPEEPAAEEPAAEEPAAEEPAAEEPAPAEQAPAAAAPKPPAAEPAEPEEQLGPKERRRRARGQAREQRPARTLEERLAERAAGRERLAGHRRTRRAREREQRPGVSGERTRPQPEAVDKATGAQRTRQGIVVSDKADKTITVKIDVARPHRVYKKIVRTSSTLHAHDERNEAHIGDTVRIIEARPLSKTKRWRLVEILERAR